MTMRQLRLRYGATCRTCHGVLPPGTTAWWDTDSKSALCTECEAGAADEPAQARADAGASAQARADAGASAQAEYERRRDNREQRVREKYPRIGGALLAIAGEPQHQRAWKQGAAGERAVAKRLAKLEPKGVLALHDRRVPGSRANIDHIAVSPAGVFVIDAKRWSGKVEVRDVSARFKPADKRLYAGGRDRSKAVEGVVKQMAIVRSALDGPMSVTVRGMLAISGAEFPLLNIRGFELDGVRIGDLDNMIGALRAGGELTEPTRRAIFDQLAERLPPAT